MNKIKNKEVVNFTEISRNNKCCVQTVCNIVARNNIEIPEELKIKTAKKFDFKKFTIEPREKMWKEESEKATVYYATKPEKIEIWNSNAVISVQLFDDRHPNYKLPSESIFGSMIPVTKINDYEFMDKIVEEFIQKKKYENPEFEKLIVYVSGFVPANASVIKASVNNNIDLTMMHWNPDTSKYDAQEIINKNNLCDIKMHPQLKRMIENKRLTKASIYNMNLQELENIEHIFAVTINKMMPNLKTVIASESIYCSNRNDMWRQYNNAVNDAYDNKNMAPMQIFADETFIKEDSYVFGEILSRYFNYTKVE